MNIQKGLELLTKYKTLLEKHGINTKLRKAHFLTQLDYESGFKPVAENMNYSAKRLREVFPKYFTVAQANQYAGQPTLIGSRVYASRMGNGNEATRDGYKFRGRGLIQLTGKNNYTALSKDTGIDYLNNPDLLLTEADSMISALWFWKQNGINKYADIDDIDGVSDLVNIGRKTTTYGDAHGFGGRKATLEEYKKHIK